MKNFKTWWENLLKDLSYAIHPSGGISSQEAKERSEKYSVSNEDLIKDLIAELNYKIKNKIEQGETSISVDIIGLMSLFVNNITDYYVEKGYVVKILDSSLIEGIQNKASYLWISWRN